MQKNLAIQVYCVEQPALGIALGARSTIWAVFWPLSYKQRDQRACSDYQATPPVSS